MGQLNQERRKIMTETVVSTVPGTLDQNVRLDAPPKIEVLASGLESPRKLSFGPDGALYVAEAGRGGSGASIPSPSQPGAVLSYGATGAISRIQNGKVERVVTGLPSLALPDGGDASGVNDIEFDATGKVVSTKQHTN
jgi:glucose/arabinose dehydrogenase